MSTHEARLPKEIPEKGFYYHYKHDPEGKVYNYAYEILGVGHHTEDDCRPEDEYMMAYRPLYEDALVYKLGKLFDLRPLGMWMGDVELKGKVVKRFTRITDPAVIAELVARRIQMYGA